MLDWVFKLLDRGPNPSENYSPRAQKLLILARKQADRLHLSYVGTEHLLLGLLDQGEGVGFAALQNLGPDPKSLRQLIEARCKPGKETVIAPSIPMTPRVANVLKFAAAEARRMGQDYVGTEHILLGLVRQRWGIAAAVLRSFQVDLGKARAAVAAAYSTPSPKP